MISHFKRIQSLQYFRRRNPHVRLYRLTGYSCLNCFSFNFPLWLSRAVNIAGSFVASSSTINCEIPLCLHRILILIFDLISQQALQKNFEEAVLFLSLWSAQRNNTTWIYDSLKWYKNRHFRGKLSHLWNWVNIQYRERV